jgi:predicted AAA+ superfamily ATPase
MQAFGGVLITGPKWCGKSWTASNQAVSEVFIDKEENKQRALLLPDIVLEGEVPRLIDEWQDAPILWDAARRIIDERHRPGQFIFTGSATLREQKASHSGTGRFARLRMRPLSLFESGDSSGSVSLKALFDTGCCKTQASKMDAKRAIHLICKGGWPASFWISEPSAMLIAREYVKAIIAEDINLADGVKKNPANVERFLRSLARNTATTVKLSKLGADMSADGSSLSEQTIHSYYDALKLIFVIEEQGAWSPSLRSRVRIRTTPKRHFSDPSLAAAALGATPEMLMEDIRTAGFLFESLCFRDLSVYAEVLGGTVFHYQDETGLEVDAIVVLPDGRWGAFEIKMGTFEFDKAAENLRKLKAKVASAMKAPSFLALLTASGGVAYTQEDGVAIIPIDCLGS